VAGLAVRRVFGASVAAALPVLFALSALGAAHCNILAVPRVFYSMAHDGLLPRSLARVAKNTGTPNRAIALIATLASVFGVLGSYDRLTNMTAYSYLVFYALTTIGFLWSCRVTPRCEWGLRLGQIVVVAALFLLGALWLIVTSVLRGTAEVMLATGLVAMGMPVFVALRLLRSRASPSTDGSGGQ
jgi:APA family basic amino acid/polyamine antiporter